MVSKNLDLSFQNFYMLEFFTQVRGKSKGKISEKHQVLLDWLGKFILSGDTILAGLEKLAQYKGTNELSIFLFDMSERIGDYAPQMIYGTLPDLVDDFINLFRLMMDDEECEKDLETLLGESAVTTEAPAAEEIPLLSFTEFFQQERENKIQAALQNILPKEKRNQFAGFIEICQKCAESAKTYDPQALSLLHQVQTIYTAQPIAPSVMHSLNSLQQQIDLLFEQLDAFASEKEALFRQIIAEKKIPAPVKEKAAVRTEPLTVDALLQEYFISEINDHIDTFRATLNKENKDQILPELIKQFKSLKEISMIHGHSGIEYFIDQIVKALTQAVQKNNRVGETTSAALEALCVELQDISQFDKKGDEQLKKIERLVGQLSASFEGADTERQVQAKAETRETEETHLAFEDKEAMFRIGRELISALYKKAQTLVDLLPDEQALHELITLLQSSGRSLRLLHPQIESGFFRPLALAYQRLWKRPVSERTDRLNTLQTAWRHIGENLNTRYDFAALKANFTEAAAGEAAYAANSVQAVSALLESMRSLWAQTENAFNAALIAKDEAAQTALNAFFNKFEENLHLLGLEHYKPAAAFFMMLPAQTRKTSFTEGQVQEIKNSFELVLDRLEAKGKDGEIADIIEVLQEVLAQEEKPETETVSEETAAPEITEDERFFREEALAQLKSAQKALSELEKNSAERQSFRTIESAVHNIRSSAHLLQKDKIGDFAVTLEETAEMFESAEVEMPEELPSVMRQAIAVLEQLIQGEEVDTEPAEKAIEQVLNQLILEEEPVEEVLADEKPGSGAQGEEQPLFAEEENLDEELLQIFQDESQKFIVTLEKENQNLKKDLKNEEALKNMEYAAHSLKSSAKMLGFREISQLTDGLEDIMEAIAKEEISNSAELQENIALAIRTIKQLREGEKVSSGDLAKVINQLDISEKRIQAPAPQPAEDRRHVTEVFYEEASDLVEKLNHELLELEKMPESGTLLAEILRYLHTLKGSALMVRFERIGNLAHKLEDYFEVYKRQNAQVKQEMLNPTFTAMDLIQDMLKSIKEGQGEDAPQWTSKLAEIDNKLYFYQNFAIGTEASKIIAAETRVKSKAGRTPQKEDGVIKINTSYLDKLINMATELVVNRTELAGHFEHLKELLVNIEKGRKKIHETKNIMDDVIEDITYSKEEIHETEQTSQSSENESEIQDVSSSLKELTATVDRISAELNKLSDGFDRNIQQISNLSKNLHSDILKVRMLPVENLFDRFPRLVRDLAKKQEKKVNLSMEGNEAELDRAMIEALVDPLMHIIRNAVDHGLETPAERAKLNKNKSGNITLRARQEKSQVIIDVSDDGRGIDIERVKEKIILRELATQEEVAQMTEAEILDFIFYPEFSTNEKTTDVSGRGVGLDVVANQIQKLKGIIRIRTEKNVGTTFSIRVPLTLVISQALMTRHAGNQIAIPMIAVQESLEIERQEILMDDKRRYVQVHGKLLPYITIEEILNYGETKEELAEKRTVLILHDAGVSLALGIGEITGRQEIVIKSLGKQMQNVEFIAGGTILGNGDVALILDYAAVIRLVEFQFFGSVKVNRNNVKSENQAELHITQSTPTMQKNISKRIVANRKPRILVVDDSSSVRSFVGSVLEKRGFVAIRASDGEQADEILQKEIIDLIITDLEMPTMDGFSLIKKIRSQKKFDEMPIVILTGRSGKQQQEKGEALGANSFIGKPFKESDLLRVVLDFVEIAQA